ncbi:MAG TPA: DUF1116 domain-containing protein [Mycobacteriales bacterium]|nr:DUF1116 domain-containing protein [Mycobacteriales bacterium]
MTAVLDRRAAANTEAARRMCAAAPVLVDVQPAGAVVPAMTPATILTSGPPLPWAGYVGGQRHAIMSAAVYEGLAAGPADADAALTAGRIRLGGTHDHGCVGSVAGVYTASMPVFVVEDANTGRRGYCNLYEGESRYRLNYGRYDADVAAGLDFLRDRLGPVLAEATARLGGVPLTPLIGRALRMGDELHSRNTAATTLFAKAITPALLDMAAEGELAAAQSAFGFLAANDYTFLRLSMAAAKVAADAARNVPFSSVVTAMSISCTEFGIRVSGLGDAWFRGPLPDLDCRLFDGYTEADIEWMGGESHITETTGLGGFAQAAAFALQQYQGGSPAAMVAMNERMYEITVAEHPEYRIPYLGFRGTPVGIDVFRVLATGIQPVIDGGLAGRGGGQIGAGILRAPLPCFDSAATAWTERYG